MVSDSRQLPAQDGKKLLNYCVGYVTKSSHDLGLYTVGISNYFRVLVKDETSGEWLE